MLLPLLHYLKPETKIKKVTTPYDAIKHVLFHGHHWPDIMKAIIKVDLHTSLSSEITGTVGVVD